MSPVAQPPGQNAPVDPPDVKPRATDPVASLTVAIRDFGSIKHIAHVAGCSETTAERYRRGTHLPDIIRLAKLATASRAIRDAFLRMIGLDDASLDAWQLRLEHESDRDRAETLRIGGPPDVQPDKPESADEGRGARRRG